MSAIKNGGYNAFPLKRYDETQHQEVWQNGLTKREALAMAAMQGLVFNCREAADAAASHSKAIAEDACKLADALLEALAKEGS